MLSGGIVIVPMLDGSGTLVNAGLVEPGDVILLDKFVISELVNISDAVVCPKLRVLEDSSDGEAVV